jgi:hypothetical protein
MDRFGVELITLHCERVYACCEDEGLCELVSALPLREPYPDAQACIEGLRERVPEGIFQQEKGLIAAGTLEYQGDAAAACLDMLRGVSCSEFLEMPPVWPQPGCQGVFTGKVPLGGACGRSDECATEGSYCDWMEATGGTCKPLPGEGESCTLAGLCMPGLQCVSDPVSDVLTCAP